MQPASPRSEIIKKLKPHQNLLAVSKLQPVEKIMKLAKQGQIHFGENYVQEALEKIEKLINYNIQWHLIGPLQKNKIKFLKKHFSYIHSVDSVKLAQLLSENAEKNSYVQKVFLQINLSGEVTKSGLTAAELQTEWPKLNNLKGLSIIGLMTMPPLENSAENNRIFFNQLKKLGQKLNLKEFSMGTSQDYQVALEEGATWIRIGTVLFGARSKKSENESRSS